ncbi:cytochrome c nitrite reductase small subunit [bacterium SCSIO 12741]|nr:cytochrome c nitrite reductase small subunit [bacterium SCSIO 12741]
MNFKESLLPNKKSRWRPVAVFILSAAIGLGLFMAHEAKVTSYLSDDPQACVNCHVMTPAFNGWMHSSHREWVSCNGCHVPQDNFFNAYYFKAKDGLYHASIFTLRAEPDVMFMREASENVVQDNCIRCHVQQVTETKYADYLKDHTSNRTERKCWSCHREIPHGKIQGMSTVKYDLAPRPTDKVEAVIPEWLQNELNK